MTEVLKTWLSKRLKYTIMWAPEEFGGIVSDGILIAKLLYSYNIISEQQVDSIVTPTADTAILLQNLKKISIWLKSIDVSLNDAEMKEISECKGSAAMRLFYKLYLALDNKDRLDFIAQEQLKKSPLIEKPPSRFEINKIDEKKKFEQQVLPLVKPLVMDAKLAEWQKKKEDEIKLSYKNLRKRYMQKMDDLENDDIAQEKNPAAKAKIDRDKKHMEMFAKIYPFERIDYSYKQLKALEERALLIAEKGDQVNVDWAFKFIEKTKKKAERSAENVHFQKQMKSLLLSSLWDKYIKKEEKKFDENLTRKTLKLSQYEKQICSKLLESKRQFRNIIENRLQAQEKIDKERHSQFDQLLNDLRDELLREGNEFALEKQRQMDLHKRLNDERSNRKLSEIKSICKETFYAMVDIATKICEFKEQTSESEVPRDMLDSWKHLYFTVQPIYDFASTLEDLLVRPKPLEFDEILDLEEKRQLSLDINEFNFYHNKVEGWDCYQLLPNYEPGEKEKLEYMGERILTHIIYTLYSIKYPDIDPKKGPKLPNVKVSAILLDVPSPVCLPIIEQLLAKQNIKLIDLQAAINYCLRRFKTEMVGYEKIDLSFAELKKASPKIDASSVIHGVEDIPEETVARPNDKMNQTPKTIPEDDIVLSTAADLGKYAFEVLSSGDTLTDYLLVAIFVEYLALLQNIDGWVLLNFPKTYIQAKILEEALTGKKMPKRDEEKEDKDDDNAYLDNKVHKKERGDTQKATKESRLLQFPQKARNISDYISYFTAFIKLRPTKNLATEDYIWNLTEANSTLLEIYYAEQGINYSIYYERMDKEVMKCICKYIVGDFKMPIKTSTELFGEDALLHLEDAFPDTITKSKVVKSSSTKPKESTQSLNSAYSDQEVQSVEPSAENTDQVVVEEPPKPLPGEPGWVFSNWLLPEKFATTLAMLWEAIEDEYIRSMEDLLFAKRLQFSLVGPYSGHVREHMNKVVTKPCLRQDIVLEFQTLYNQFDDDRRLDNNSRHEWYCRTEELRRNLYDICDKRKIEAEHERRDVIKENWASEELNQMTNIFVACMQTELNRSIATFQLMHDFYFSMLKRQSPIDRIKSAELLKIPPEAVVSLKDFGADIITSLKAKKPEYKLRTDVQDILIKVEDFHDDSNPYSLYVQGNHDLATKQLNALRNTYANTIKAEEAEIVKQKANVKGVKPPVGKKGGGPGSVMYIPTPEVSEKLDILDQIANIISEWDYGVQGEMARMQNRLSMILNKAFRDLALFKRYIIHIFSSVRDEIDARYEKEIESVDKLCDVIKMAIEDGVKISELLRLKTDGFLYDINFLFVPPTEPLPPRIQERTSENTFKISQLIRMRDKLSIVSPQGGLLERPFVFILQDFIVFGIEDPDGAYVPESWLKLESEDIPKLANDLYGNTEYVDWKDFIILATDVPFPSLEILLYYRQVFKDLDETNTETLTRDQFNEINLWFDLAPHCKNEGLINRMSMVKELLFSLFETSPDIINYSAFLLAFCRDEDPKVGFAKALSVSMGKIVCWDPKLGEDFKMGLIDEMGVIKSASALSSAYNAIDEILNRTMNMTEGVCLEDYTSPHQSFQLDSIAETHNSVSEDIITSTKPFDPESLYEIASIHTVTVENAQPKSMFFQVIIDDTFLHAFMISLCVCKRVLMSTVPWQCRVHGGQPIKSLMDLLPEIEDKLRINEHSDEVYTHALIAHPAFDNLINSTHRFKLVYPTKIVDEIINSK